MTARIEAQIERFAPGFRDLILARHADRRGRGSAEPQLCRRRHRRRAAGHPANRVPPGDRRNRTASPSRPVPVLLVHPAAARRARPLRCTGCADRAARRVRHPPPTGPGAGPAEARLLRRGAGHDGWPGSGPGSRPPADATSAGGPAPGPVAAASCHHHRAIGRGPSDHAAGSSNTGALTVVGGVLEPARLAVGSRRTNGERRAGRAVAEAAFPGSRGRGAAIVLGLCTVAMVVLSVLCHQEFNGLVALAIGLPAGSWACSWRGASPPIRWAGCSSR